MDASRWERNILDEGKGIIIRASAWGILGRAIKAGDREHGDFLTLGLTWLLPEKFFCFRDWTRSRFCGTLSTTILEVKFLCTDAEMRNAMDKTVMLKTPKSMPYRFAKGLLDVAHNLGRASFVVKESFSKLYTLKDTAGAIPLLKTLLEGVEMPALMEQE